MAVCLLLLEDASTLLELRRVDLPPREALLENVERCLARRRGMSRAGPAERPEAQADDRRGQDGEGTETGRELPHGVTS
jgi:hypothetical protein